MSNDQRYSSSSSSSSSSSRQTNYKTHQKFVPKSLINLNDTKFSSSLRQSLSSNQSNVTASSSSSSSASRLPAKAAVTGGNFVNYLPQDEAVAAGLGADEGGLDPLESQQVVDHLNSHLSRLLKLRPRDFWREVASDNSLHEFLHTYLQFRTRWYDFPYHGSKGKVAGVVFGEFELSRHVFMLLYRVSSSRDPDAHAADSLSTKDHAVILQDKRLLDLPKLLDICAVYGHENEDLTRLLVGNALKAQPWIYDYFPATMPHFPSIVHTMQQRCSSFLEALFSSANHENNGAIQSNAADLLEVMDFINDAVVSMDAFVLAYKPAAVFFAYPVEMSHGNKEVLSTLAQLHDSLIPSLLRAFSIIYKGGEDKMKSDITVSSKMLSMRLVNFSWKLFDICYLNDDVFEDNLPIPAVTKMFPANVEDPGIRADILVQTFREINGVVLQAPEKPCGNTFLQNLEKNFNVISRLESLQSSGWIFMDDDQIQYLSGIMMCVPEANVMGSSVVKSPITSNKVVMEEDAAIMESKISQIKDLFPDYGKGFVYACLEAYNQNPEEVIQRILEGTLHDDLKSLDTSLEIIPKPKPAVTVNRIDKGKGKLVESSTMPLTNPVSANFQKIEQASVSSSSTIGRYVRKSKANSPTTYSSPDARDKKDIAKTAALLSQYEYEDEYDDSFDDLGLSVADSRFDDNERMNDKTNSNFVRSWGTESQTPAQTAPKWGSRKKPQYYVKDGKNYSYKVEGSVAVANASEASIITQSQQEMIHGLGRGGNLPLGASKKLMDHVDEGDQPPLSETGNARGRGKRAERQKESNVEQDNGSDNSEVARRGNIGNQRGGRGGQRGGGRHNNYRKDQAMKKHFSGLSGM